MTSSRLISHDEDLRHRNDHDHRDHDHDHHRSQPAPAATNHDHDDHHRSHPKPKAEELKPYDDEPGFWEVLGGVLLSLFLLLMFILCITCLDPLFCFLIFTD